MFPAGDDLPLFTTPDGGAVIPYLLRNVDTDEIHDACNLMTKAEADDRNAVFRFNGEPMRWIPVADAYDESDSDYAATEYLRPY